MKRSISNADIARIFEKMSRVLALKGKDRFRILAYENAARSVRDLDRDLSEIAAENRLQEIPGIGKDLAGKIEEALKTGCVKQCDRPKGDAHSVRECRSTAEQLLTCSGSKQQSLCGHNYSSPAVGRFAATVGHVNTLLFQPGPAASGASGQWRPGRRVPMRFRAIKRGRGRPSAPPPVFTI
jgi:Helix-hairpin-helix domain